MTDDEIGRQGDAGTAETGRSDGRRRRGLWVAGIVAAAIAIAAIVWGVAVAPRDAGQASATDSPSSSGTPAATPSPDDSASQTPTPDPSTPAATADPDDPFPEQSPVAPEETGSADGISVDLTKFESVTGEVVGPGDVEAAAVRVTIDITNTGDDPLNLDLVVMNAYMGAQRDPAETYEKPGGQPVSGSLAPGKTATGVYLFRIPEDRRDDVTFVVDYHAGMPAITWRGQVP